MLGLEIEWRFLRLRLNAVKGGLEEFEPDAEWDVPAMRGARPLESVENLIQKHTYARSPIRTYGGDDDGLGDETQVSQTRGSAFTTSDNLSLSTWVASSSNFSDICIATAISLLMITICGMATYGAYKQLSAWIIPFFCYQIFDFALNTLVAISVVVYPTSIQDYLRQLPANLPHKEDLMSMNPTCLVFIVLTFVSIILAFKAYLIGCVWNCYRYINGRHLTDVLVYMTNDTAILLPPNEEAAAMPTKDPAPPYMSA
ncbi:hypothetical protein scyTo_0006929 [Scyliorhinus torazame]|uniref:Lysosomal-associated transmembrane protein 4B n=1 Tax=Scyliorhinus torazame TaxID=75743 RepID=A0A401NIS5_SCYTO|nr:hypothetical protein [Scyliorhinus torazame]